MSRKLVLLVSEDPKFFELPDNTFQSRGCDVFTAMDAQGAVEFIEANTTALVILHGVPKGIDSDRVGKALGSGALILVLREGDTSDGWSSLDRIEIIPAEASSKALLRASVKVLGVAERKYVSILVQVRVTRPKQTTIFGKSRDLSQTGILVETNQALLIHDIVTVSFLIPGAERMIQASAIVMREVRRPDGSRRYGLQFHSLSDEDHTIVQQFLGGKLDAEAS